MDLIKKIEKLKKEIFKFIEDSLNKNYKKIFFEYGNEKLEVFELYKKFIKKGKGIRGGLVFLADEIFSGKKILKENLFYLGSFFEIIHSSLLIHDDFMDQDKTRRGSKTINYFFEEKFSERSKNQNHLGNSIAVNIGDIGFFIGFDLINKLKLNNNLKKEIINFLIKDYIKVALGQIDDVLFSQTSLEPEKSVIKKIYLYKTARYTFVLPVISTLILKKNQLAYNKNLIKILENLGIIFQITDDVIGFLSDETEKDIGSDIRENKKTLIRYYLFNELKDNNLKNIFGKENLKNEEILKIRNFYQQSNSKIKIEKIIERLKIETKKFIEKEIFPVNFKHLVTDFLDFLTSRKK